jgi:hypothetical protein
MSNLKVPEGMLKAAIDAAWRSADVSVEHVTPYVQVGIEAALRWQKDNAPRPSIPQAQDILKGGSWQVMSTTPQQFAVACQGWVRRMYDDPEPEVPEDECNHEHLNEDGACRRCGEDCRGIH